MTDAAEAAKDDDDFEKAFDEYASGRTAYDDDIEEEDYAQDADDSDEEESAESADQEPQAADPWSQVPEALRQEYTAAKSDVAALMHRAKSDSGRIAALQKKIEELQQHETAVDKASGEKQQHEAQELSDKWKELAEDYPEIAAAIEARLSAIDKKYETSTSRLNQAFQETVEPIRQNEKARYVQSQLAALDAAQPDWRDVVKSKSFGEWFDALPPSVQALRQSDDAADAAYLIDAYKRTKLKASAELDRIEQRRTERMTNAVATRGTGNAPKSTPPDDFEAAFNAYVAADERRARRRA